MAEKKQVRFTFDAESEELARMLRQRAKQEGITVSEYIREAIILEMFFSGDLEATKYVLNRVSKRMKSVLVDKLGGTDLPAKLEVLGQE